MKSLATATPKKSARKIKGPIWAAIVLAAFAGMFPLWARIRGSLQKPPAPPSTVVARKGDITVEVQETGTIQPEDKVDVRSKVAGRLLTLSVQEGQRVKAGQLIATVDRTLLDPQIAQMQAQLTQAKAHLVQSEAAYRLQVVQTRMAVAQADAGLKTALAHLASVSAGARPQELAQQEQAVRRAQVTLDDAIRTQTRKQSLVTKGFIAQSDADTAQTAVDTARSNLATMQQALSLTQAGPRVQDVNDAQAQVSAARVQLESAQGNVLQDDVRKSDIAQSQASLAQISGNLAQLQVQVGDTQILAPADGIVLKKYRLPGEIVQSATTGMSDAQSLIITLGSRLEVLVGINEVDMTKVKKGASVMVEVDAVPGAKLAGVVTEIAPASTNAFASSDSSSGSGGQSSISKFSVKIGFLKYDPRLLPGMSAQVTILSARHQGAVLVPLDAVPFTEDKGTVQVLDAAGKPQSRPIVTGLRNDIDAEILSGLKPGEKLVVKELAGKRRTINIAGPGGD